MLMRLRQTGISVIELMVGVAILAIVLATGLPSYSAWIHNTRIRVAAESIVNGLQLARAEALRRNTSVAFELGQDDSGWTVSVVATAELIQSRPSAQGSAGVTVARTPAAATTVTFNGMGRIAPNPGGSATLTQVSLDVPPSMLPANLSRELNVTVSPAGQVRMCDPNASDPQDPRRC
jgi:type IV fimbrial biogenesis protein FimT